MGRFRLPTAAQQATITAVLLFDSCLPLMASAGVAWLVQLSDLHISDHAEATAQFSAFGDRLGDLHLFSQSVLTALRPGAVLLTGDLTDAKSPSGVWQSVTEWEAYRKVVARIVEAGLPESHVLDLRGNHDTFAVPARCGPGDFFPKFAAAGRRNGTARVFLQELSAAASANGECPVAQLLGIDLAIDPGLSGTNFMGRASAALLQEIDATLSRSKADLSKRGCSCPTVAYGHYPLGVVAHPETQPWWIGAKRPSAALPAHMRTVKALLAHHNVSAYLNGHLHAAFGRRLHAMHPSAVPGKYLMELETTAWKDDRRFRVLAVDNDLVSFVDFSLNTPTKGVSSASVVPSHTHTYKGWNFSMSAPSGRLRSHSVVDNIVLITSPPDSRYSTLATAPSNGRRAVRALLLRVMPGSEEHNMKVELVWRCQKGAQNASGKAFMERVTEGEPLWGVSWPSEAACAEEITTIQVIASDGSMSEERPVGDPGKPSAERKWHSSLDLSLLDQIRSVAIWSNWPPDSYRVMFGLWGLHFFGLLLLPRMLLILGLRTMGIDLPSKGWLARTMLSGLLYPVTALCDMASVQRVWLPQVLYSAYLFAGPWMRAKLLKGEPAGLLFLGRILLIEKGRYKYQHNPDTTIFSTLQMLTVLLPLTLWLATITSRWLHYGQLPSKRWRPWRYMNPLQLLILLAVLFMSYNLSMRFARLAFGIEALIFGPGMAWTSPLLSALLLALYSKQVHVVTFSTDKRPRRVTADGVAAKAR